MSSPCEVAAKQAAGAPLGFVDRFQTRGGLLWIVARPQLGRYAPAVAQGIGALEVAQVNLPVGVLIWVMIIPMLVKIDFGALHEVREQKAGMGVTLFVNWAVKPFSMALIGWLFIKVLFADWLPAGELDSYMAGLILLGAAPCTAMVFVWSNLCNGNANFTLTQVALNDLVMVFAFAPIVALLLGVSSIPVPWDTLLLSVPPRPADEAGGSILPGSAGEDLAVLHSRPARHPGAAVLLPGQDHRRAAAGDRHPRRAAAATDPVHRRARLLAMPHP